jgi:hypothetical protein
MFGFDSPLAVEAHERLREFDQHDRPSIVLQAGNSP